MQTASHEVIVVIPTYNEAENLERLVGMLLDLPLALGILVVDDNSPDGTGQLAERLALGAPTRIEVVHRAEKRGLGSAYLFAFEKLMPQQPRFIVAMDADFSHHPRYLPEMVQSGRDGFDLVIGSRYVPGGATPGFPLSRQILSRGGNLLARGLIGLRALDATAGYRCYKREALVRLPLQTVRSSGYSFQIEMLTLFQRGGFRIGELPILFEDRRCGHSKISKQEILLALKTVMRLSGQRLIPSAGIRHPS
ncbi:MAG TPA: polyprenol monophosphomannose synthase [Acidobacteriota bacterium]